jgi:hypothetical protein
MLEFVEWLKWLYADPLMGLGIAVMLIGGFLAFKTPLIGSPPRRPHRWH